MFQESLSACKLRTSSLVSIVAASVLAFGPLSPLRSEEGMYPMSGLSKLDLSARGIELSAEQLFNPDAISLVDGVCRVNGCTGSFVSDSGLIITNHHCAYGAIQKASTSERDLLRDGFHASTNGEEIPAPDYTVRVTEGYRDVSEQVLASVQPGMDFASRKKAIDVRCRELEAEAEKATPALRAEVAEMFAGKTYVLFQYTYLKDIRLVFAPPQSVGNFGGEVDNWMWPRHTGDFSFMRAYTAPDGSSATYDEANVPYKPKRFVQVSAAGVQEGDAVFLLGYPGRTARHKTASFLEYEENIRLPLIVDLYNWQIDVMTKAGLDDRSVEIKHASRMRSLANVEKRSRGQLQGLKRAGITQSRRDKEAELRSFINGDPDRAQRYGSILDEIDSVYADMSLQAPAEIYFQQAFSACKALGLAMFAVDYANQRQLPNVERESRFNEKNIEQSIARSLASIGDYHRPTDVELLQGIVQRLRSVEADTVIDGIDSLLETNPEQLLSRSEMVEADAFNLAITRSPEDLARSDDPVLKLAIELYPAYTRLREKGKARDGRLGQLYGDLVDVKQQFLKQQFVPDANATLRFTCGYVRRYSPGDAIIKTPISTFQGVLEKTTGTSPFDTPRKVLEAYHQGNHGPFFSKEIGDIPVAILYNTDTTGGNSGSPIFNARGELVGVNFDRCFEATINDFAWNESYSRSIGVDIRYVLWVTGYAYDAKHLLEEMGVK